MSKDYRTSFVRDVEAALAANFGPDQVALISNVVVKALADYEITERCTDLAPLDDVNERLIKRYRACLMVDGKSESTISQYTRSVRKLIELIPKPVTEMGAYDIRFFLASEQERGISARTRENQRANLSTFFQWMTDDDIIPKNPISKLKSIKYPDEVKTPFADVELDALRGACRTLKERALIEMLISTGVRVSELSNMDVADINMNTLSVHVVHGKGSKERMTYTTPVSVKHLQTYIKNRPDTGTALFYNNKHERLASGGIEYILNELAKRAGVNNVYPHRFRRTFATNLAKRGMAIQEIQKLLGHSSIETTMQYICVDDANIKTSYNKFIA